MFLYFIAFTMDYLSDFILSLSNQKIFGITFVRSIFIKEKQI